MAAEPDSAFDEQDQAEILDEDNNELEEQRYGGRPNEQTLEDLPDVLDVTQKVGDEEDDDAPIGEDLDDDEIIDLARDEDAEDLEDDDLIPGDPQALDRETDITAIADADLVDVDEVDHVADLEPEEVELEYVGDLTDLEGASSGAQAFESDTLSDNDLRELDYKDEFTIDDDEPDAPPS